MQTRNLILSLISTLLLSCHTGGNSQVKENASISDQKEVLKNNNQTNDSLRQEELTNSGFKLMQTENIGDITFGLTSKEIINMLGEPEKISEPFFSEVDGETYQHFEYKKAGIFLSFVIKNDTTKEVRLIEIKEPCNLKTSRQIGIGSFVSEIKKSYKDYINAQDSDSTEIVAGSIYGGIIFSIENLKVKSIYIGATAD